MRWIVIAWFTTSIGSIAFVPFLAAVLTRAGWSELGVVGLFALLPAGNLFGAPMWSRVADGTGRPARVLQIATITALFAALGLASSTDPLVVVPSLAAYSFARSALTPVGDALVVTLLGEAARDYGRYRAWGSVAYLLVALAGGAMLDLWSHAPIALGLALAVPCAVLPFLLPEPEQKATRPRRQSALRVVLSDRVLATALAVAWLQGMTITGYDLLYSLHVDNLSLPGWVTGGSIAAGVIAEVTVLRASRRVLEWLGPKGALLLGVGAGIPRWLVVATVADPVLLVLTQVLHGLCFGSFWLAGIAMFSERVPGSMRSSAQASWTASMFGGGFFTTLLVASLLVPIVGTQGFYATNAGISVLALLLAFSMPHPR